MPTEIKGHGFTIDPDGELAGVRLWRASIKAETPLRIPWGDWVIELSNEFFISAWVVDPDYQFWQSVENLSHCKMFGRPWKHLPTKPSGLPPPLEQIIVEPHTILDGGFFTSVSLKQSVLSSGSESGSGR